MKNEDQYRDRDQIKHDKRIKEKYQYAHNK